MEDAESEGRRGCCKNPCVVLALLSLSVLLSISTWLASSVVTNYLANLYGVPASDSSLLTVSTQAGFMISAALQAITMLPDRVNCRYLMSSGATMAALVNVLLLLAPTFAAAIACRLLTGMAMALIYPPATKVLATWFLQNRGLAMSVLVGSIAPGSAVPNLIKALPVGNLWNSREGFVLLTVTTSCLSVFGAIIPVCFLSDGPHPFPRSGHFSWNFIPRIFKNRDAALVIGSYCGHMWELYAMWSSLPLFFQWALQGHHYSETVELQLAAMLTCITISLGGVSCVMVGLLAERWGRTTMCLLCCLTSGTVCFFVGIVAEMSQLPVLVLVVIIWGIFVVPDSPQYTTLVVELVDPTLVGTALVLQQGLGYLCTIPMIFAIPVLADTKTVGWQNAFDVLGLGAIVSIVLLLFLHFRLRRGPASNSISLVDPNVASVGSFAGL